MTTYEVRNSPNYAAEVIEVKTLVPLAGCDNVQGLVWAGYQAVVGKDVKVGDIMVMFPAESQLSEAYAFENNLHRHGDRNRDQSAKGYIEDNRRVKAMKFRGHRSDALAMPLSSLAFIDGAWPWDTAVGTAFDTVNGVEICRKYEIPVKANPYAAKSPAEKAFKRVDNKMLPEHIDTENYFRNAFKIGPDEHITVTQKLHGTSIRLGNVLVRRELNWRERLAKRFGIKVAETEYDYVFGSRKVIKDPHNPRQDHFYDYDMWSKEGAKYEHLIPKNVVLYGELIGWTENGGPIQSGYTYNVPQGEAHLYVYRVAFVGADGGLYDLSWDGVKEFCTARGLNFVPELWSGAHYYFEADDWLDTKYADKYLGAVPLSLDSPVDEGVVVRREGVLPTVLKAKSPIFLGHETALLDQGQADLESVG